MQTVAIILPPVGIFVFHNIWHMISEEYWGIAEIYKKGWLKGFSCPKRYYNKSFVFRAR